MIALLQWFNEAILMPTAVVLNVAARLVRAFYFGFRGGAVEAGASLTLSSIISGFIVTGLLLALLWIGTRVVRRYRMKNPRPIAIRIGTVAFWLGCAIGIYFLGVTFYLLAQLSNPPSDLLGYLVGTILLYPALGRLIRYVLGR